ncbi:electron transport complex protein RnfG [Alkalithermobacter thermoalcaliphilus JW-YL-7 = DSM 7308]|uniref:Ion-translocating oxidoreductase complex subunit G n=1 Tax=Alkalithermobacter thermoalcaliphilus JW-YL-7 = DSM 7308 TaxID=1121328 RepID=A0A150FRF2_CLOPD|nr:electron transport complex, RnfABCDGE type, G subunit [[Clostridium] paradoxum JW-YL-7 = DSM 7308]SHK44185.1 electron transport complex protein RnfG [[Clostridium] paradoxum JW-YL-7 = DSM 7308]
MKDILKLGVILLIITSISGVVLGFTNNLTLPYIQRQAQEANNLARQEVLPGANEFEKVDIDIQSSLVKEIYKGLNGNDVVGYTIKTTPKGYSGEIEVIVGIGIDGTIHGVNIGNHSETPGLGAKASEEEFKGQYKNKKANENIEVIKSGIPKEDEVISIAGATITSQAVTDGVNESIRIFNEVLK